MEEVHIVDAELENLDIEQTVGRIPKDGKVLIVVMGNNPSVSSTPKMPVAEALAKRLTKEGQEVIFTGIHPIANGCKWTVIKQPFEGMPMPAWDLLPNLGFYRAHNWHCLDGSPRQPYAVLYTSLNCPFDCYYCNIHTLYEGRKDIRYRPIKDIAKDLENMAKQGGLRNLKIWDELFALNKYRVIAISELLVDYKVNAWAYARLDTMTEDMLRAMKRGGINWVAYGFESIKDEKFISTTNKVVKMTRDYGINIIANFMFGLPGTTLDDDKRTLEFAMDNLFEWVNFYDAKPYPGSQWYEDEKPNIDWADYNQYGKKSVFRDMSFIRYFTEPSYLNHIEKIFGHQSVDQVNEMLRTPILV